MKRQAKHVTWLIVAVLLFGNLGQTASADNANKYADTLNSLGLFRGTNAGYELDSEVTRVQAAVMLVRLLGAEEAAQLEKNSHPFTDVPSWADHYIGYMYSNDLTKGVSSSSFNPNGECSLQMYAAFVLRALGYEDGSDFTYITASDTVDRLGLLEEVAAADQFLRRDMVTMSYFSMAANPKGSSHTLLDQLVADGTVSAETAKPVQQLFASGTESENKDNDGEETKMPMIKITAGDTVLTAEMQDNETARDFISMLPLTLTLKDYAGTEKVSDLPQRLSMENAPEGYDPSVGTIAYYSPWGNIAIFYQDFGYSRGLVPLGDIVSGIEALESLEGDFTVTIELMDYSL